MSRFQVPTFDPFTFIRNYDKASNNMPPRIVPATTWNDESVFYLIESFPSFYDAPDLWSFILKHHFRAIFDKTPPSPPLTKGLAVLMAIENICFVSDIAGLYALNKKESPSNIISIDDLGSDVGKERTDICRAILNKRLRNTQWSSPTWEVLPSNVANELNYLVIMAFTYMLPRFYFSEDPLKHYSSLKSCSNISQFLAMAATPDFSEDLNFLKVFEFYLSLKDNFTSLFDKDIEDLMSLASQDLFT